MRNISKLGELTLHERLTRDAFGRVRGAMVALDAVRVNNGVVKIIKKFEAHGHFKPMGFRHKATIVDFEGSPPFLVGICLGNALYFFHKGKSTTNLEFFDCAFEALRCLRYLCLFTFSDYEEVEMIKMREALESETKAKDLDFIDDLCTVNLQDDSTPFQSLAEAIIVAGYDGTLDPFMRNHEFIDHSFKLGLIDSMLAHNENCLLNEALLFFEYLEKIKL
jgi:hypothetical protein